MTKVCFSRAVAARDGCNPRARIYRYGRRAGRAPGSFGRQGKGSTGAAPLLAKQRPHSPSIAWQGPSPRQPAVFDLPNPTSCIVQGLRGLACPRKHSSFAGLTSQPPKEALRKRELNSLVCQTFRKEADCTPD